MPNLTCRALVPAARTNFTDPSREVAPPVRSRLKLLYSEVSDYLVDMTLTAKSSGLVWAATVAASVFLVAAAIAGPRPAFALLCHQILERSFEVSGHVFAVCQRCFGIYAGMMFGLALAAGTRIRGVVRRRGTAPILVAVVLVVVDVGVEFLFPWVGSWLSRGLTGFILGLVTGAWFASSVLFPPKAKLSEQRQPAFQNPLGPDVLNQRLS